jgi:hypothetical protein
MFALVLETSFAFAFRPVISAINVQDPRIILFEDLEVLRDGTRVVFVDVVLHEASP